MSWFTRTFIASLAAVVLTTPAGADEKDWFKEARKRQHEHEKRLRKYEKKQQEWAREEQKRAEEHARESWKRQREFHRDQNSGFGGQYGGVSQPFYPGQYPAYQSHYGGYSPSSYPGPVQPHYQGPIQPGSFGHPGYYAPPASSQRSVAPSTRPLDLSGSVVLPSGRAFGFSGQFQVVPLNVWP